MQALSPRHILCGENMVIFALIDRPNRCNLNRRGQAVRRFNNLPTLWQCSVGYLQLTSRDFMRLDTQVAR